jgi:hypothetical protein
LYVFSALNNRLENGFRIQQRGGDEGGGLRRRAAGDKGPKGCPHGARKTTSIAGFRVKPGMTEKTTERTTAGMTERKTEE